MVPVADPDILDDIARRIARHADGLRARASALEAVAAATAWHSTAAASFRDDADDLAHHVRRAAAGADHAAVTLRHHAATVRQVRAALATAERAAAAGVRIAGRALDLVGL